MRQRGRYTPRNPFIALPALLLLAVFAVSCASAEDRRSQALNAGDQFLKGGKCKEAVEEYSKAVELTPDSADIRLTLARAHARCRSDMAAINEYKAAIENGASDVEVYREVVPLLIRIGQNSGAETILKKIIKKDPSDSIAYNNLGVVLNRQKKYSGAQKAFEKAIKINPSHYDSYLNLAMILENVTGDLAYANKCYKKYLSLNPDSPKADKVRDHIVQNELQLLGSSPSESTFHEYIEQGKQYLAEGRFEEAEDTFRSALRIRNASAKARANLGAALMEQGKLDEAEETLNKCLSLNKGTAECAYQLGWVYKLRGNNKSAIRMWKKALQIDPSYGNAKKTLKMYEK